MPRNRNRTRRRRGGRLTAPQIHITEAVAVSTANTVSNTTIWTSAVGTSALEFPCRIHLRKSIINVINGATASRTFVVIRRVPNGYSNPTISITTGNTSLIDFPDIMAYGFLDNGDSVPFVLDIPRPTMVFHPGDSLVLQAVTDVTSSGQTLSAMTHYAIGT